MRPGLFRRRNLLWFLAGAVVFLSSVVCGGALPAAAPQPSVDLGEPSGGGAAATAAPVQPAAPAPATPTFGAATPAPPALAPAIPERRRVTLKYPGHIRLGDSDIVRLTLEVDTLGNITPTAETAGNVVTGQTVQIPNLYETHSVIAEARLDLAGVDVRPSDVVSEPLMPGQSVTFYWSVHPPGGGTYRGTAWLFLLFIDKTTGEQSRIPLSAQTVQISTSNLLGLSGGVARTAGGIGSFVGAVLGFPFVTDVLKWLLKRVRNAG